MKDGYDVAQICLHGHVVNDSMKLCPEDSKKHCDRCGAPTISKCPSCSVDIQGRLHVSGFIGSARPLDPPAFCPKCGEPYPWTGKRVEKGAKLLGNAKMTKVELIKKLRDDASNLPHRNEDALDKLRRRGVMVLNKICPSKPYATQLLNIDFCFRGITVLGNEEPFNKAWDDGKKKVLNLLDTVLEELSIFGEAELDLNASGERSNRIFVVHGHDKEMELEAKLVLSQLGLEPVVLHDLPDKGRTIIEKFTDYADVQFAVVLLSPDDVGCPTINSGKGSELKLRPRARQNVILELGFFLGKLGRQNVLAINREVDGFDLPSDYSGVLFKPYDKAGKWKLDLVQELQEAGYKVDANNLIKKR